jgi:hypothetical protein
LHGKLVYFVDDLNMSAVSACGVQPPVELLRQWADHGWWADRDDLTQTKVIVDVRLVAAMNHKVLAAVARNDSKGCALVPRACSQIRSLFLCA